MKIKFNYVEDGDSLPSNDGNRKIRTEDLKKIYESPKIFLRKNMEVIEMSVQEQLETLFSDYTEWRRGKAKKPEYIFNMLQDISFVSILPKIVKNNYDFILEYGEEFSEMISSAVGELLRKQLTKRKEMVSIYSKLYEDLNEDRIEKVFKLDLKGVEWDDALKLCIVSHGTPKHTMNNTLRTLYSSVQDKDYKILRKLFIRLYGKEDLPKVSVYILLERALDRQRNNWVDREQHSVITNIALDEINKQDKGTIQELLKLYCEERRRTEYDQFISRRIKFSSINKEDYGKIVKAVKKLSKMNLMYKTFLDQNRVK